MNKIHTFGNKARRVRQRVAIAAMTLAPMAASFASATPESAITDELDAAKTSALVIVGAAGAVYIAVKLVGGLWRLGGRWVNRATGG